MSDKVEGMTLPHKHFPNNAGHTSNNEIANFMIGKHFRVLTKEVTIAPPGALRGRLPKGHEYPFRQKLKVYDSPGDPFAPALSFLQHGEEIWCTGFANFAGQTWVQHLCDESKRGMSAGGVDSPKQEPFWGWVPMDLHGTRWLFCLEGVREATFDDLKSMNTRSMNLKTPNNPTGEKHPLGPVEEGQNAAAEELLRAELLQAHREAELLAPPGYDFGNLFALVLRGKVASYKVFETADSLCCLCEWPEAPFHCLLLPKQASSGVEDLSEAAAAKVFKDLPKLVAAVQRASGAIGVKVTTSSSSQHLFASGPDGKVPPRRAVQHTHVHVVPCFEGDPAGLARAYGGGAELLRSMTSMPPAAPAEAAAPSVKSSTVMSTAANDYSHYQDVFDKENEGGEKNKNQYQNEGEKPEGIAASLFGSPEISPKEQAAPSGNNKKANPQESKGGGFEAGRRLSAAEAEHTLMRLLGEFHA